jgi:hypothetical protein
MVGEPQKLWMKQMDTLLVDVTILPFAGYVTTPICFNYHLGLACPSYFLSIAHLRVMLLHVDFQE